jgi:hypothetical protein
MSDNVTINRQKLSQLYFGTLQLILAYATILREIKLAAL